MKRSELTVEYLTGLCKRSLIVIHDSYYEGNDRDFEQKTIRMLEEVVDLDEEESE